MIREAAARKLARDILTPVTENVSALAVDLAATLIMRGVEIDEREQQEESHHAIR